MNKGKMHDGALERVWSDLSGSLTNWLPHALAANVQARLLKLIVE
jgi:hypothetical protein